MDEIPAWKIFQTVKEHLEGIAWCFDDYPEEECYDIWV